MRAIAEPSTDRHTSWPPQATRRRHRAPRPTRRRSSPHPPPVRFASLPLPPSPGRVQAVMHVGYRRSPPAWSRCFSHLACLLRLAFRVGTQRGRPMQRGRPPGGAHIRAAANLVTHDRWSLIRQSHSPFQPVLGTDKRAQATLTIFVHLWRGWGMFEPRCCWRAPKACGPGTNE